MDYIKVAHILLRKMCFTWPLSLPYFFCRCHAFCRNFLLCFLCCSILLLFYLRSTKYIDFHLLCEAHNNLTSFRTQYTHSFSRPDEIYNHKKKQTANTENHSTYHLLCLIYSFEVVNKILSSKSTHKQMWTLANQIAYLIHPFCSVNRRRVCM